MGVVTRGAKNAFRSGVRSTAVILILAISIGLGISMLLANQAVKSRIAKVKSEVGTTINVNPAGARGFQGGGEPLTMADVTKMQQVAHVASVNESLNLRVRTTGSTQPNFGFGGGGGGQNSGETNLVSPISPGTLGRRFNDAGGSLPTNFTLPINVDGVSGAVDSTGQPIAITSGRQLKAGDGDVAVVGKDLASKNNLKVGSTFTMYNATFTVVGISDNGTTFGNAGMYIPLATAQSISGLTSQISSAIVTVDSIDNVNSTVTALTNTLGSSVADVTAAQDNAMAAVDSLQTVQKISLFGFVIALIAAAIIIFLTMMMIVRERRREIGVLKAIGGSNRMIVTQFVVEAMVLVIISAAAGFGFAAVSGNGIANALTKSNTSTTTSTDAATGPGQGGRRFGGFGGGAFRLTRSQQSPQALVGNVSVNIDVNTLAVGLAAVVVIAIIGSAAPAYLIAKVRPAEVLRSE